MLRYAAGRIPEWVSFPFYYHCSLVAIGLVLIQPHPRPTFAVGTGVALMHPGHQQAAPIKPPRSGRLAYTSTTLLFVNNSAGVRARL